MLMPLLNYVVMNVFLRIKHIIYLKDFKYTKKIEYFPLILLTFTKPVLYRLIFVIHVGTSECRFNRSEDGCSKYGRKYRGD